MVGKRVRTGEAFLFPGDDTLSKRVGKEGCSETLRLPKRGITGSHAKTVLE